MVLLMGLDTKIIIESNSGVVALSKEPILLVTLI